MSDQTTLAALVADALGEAAKSSSSYDWDWYATDEVYGIIAARLLAAGVRVGDAGLREAAQAYIDAVDADLCRPGTSWDALRRDETLDALRAALIEGEA